MSFVAWPEQVAPFDAPSAVVLLGLQQLLVQQHVPVLGRLLLIPDALEDGPEVEFGPVRGPVTVHPDLVRQCDSSAFYG